MKNTLSYITATLLISLLSTTCFAQNIRHPNVIIIMTDDQGYGDLGVTGNPHVQTPVIDQFSRESIRFNNFYVSPVCAPTRSSLMTGRYSLRTGIRDTYNGGAIMASNEITIAEMLQQANYRTGVFGKWHLGDNYPSRPSDQGFDESVIHLAGGMGQVGDFTTYFQGDRSYFDPVLWHNNEQEVYEGYCSDIFTDQAIGFIKINRVSPFFCYLAFNAPHTPLQVPEEYYELYKNIDPASGYDDDDRPFSDMTEKDKEDARKVYAMVSNIDDNVGKLLKTLEELQIADQTLIIFMTDNGPQQTRYVAGMRGRKGNVYQGGVRVPFFLKYPSAFGTDKEVETTAAHIDILPTLATVCHVELPDDRVIDGQNLVPLMRGQEVDWSDRSLFFYWSRRYPELYNNMSLRKGNYKLVGKTNFDASIDDFELFDLAVDPYEQQNIVSERKNEAQSLKQTLDKTYAELIASENLINQPPIMVGTPYENPVTLNRNDAGGQRGIWSQQEIYGKWSVNIKEGHYDIKFKFIEPVQPNGRMYLEVNTMVKQMIHDKGETDIIEMRNVYLPAVDGELIPFYTVDRKNICPFWIELNKID